MVLDVKVKALLMLGVVIGIIVGSFQYQLNQQANHRITGACEDRLVGAETNRRLLLEVVDLSDIFPVGGEMSPELQLYIENRTQLVNSTYDQIVENADCVLPEGWELDVEIPDLTTKP